MLIFPVVNNECLIRKKKRRLLWPLINLFWSASLIGNANGIDTAVSLTRYLRWFVKQNKLPISTFIFWPKTNWCNRCRTSRDPWIETWDNNDLFNPTPRIALSVRPSITFLNHRTRMRPKGAKDKVVARRGPPLKVGARRAGRLLVYAYCQKTA